MMTVVLLPHRTSFDIRPTPPYDAILTLDKPSSYWNVFTPDGSVVDGVLWSALSIEGEPVGVRVESRGHIDSPCLGIDVYRREPLSPGDKSRIEGALATKVSPDIDLGAFYEMAEDDPILKHPVKQFRGM